MGKQQRPDQSKTAPAGSADSSALSQPPETWLLYLGGSQGRIALSPPLDLTPYETVIKLIRRRRVNDIAFQEIKEKTRFSDKALRNIISRARTKEDIQNQGRGLYIKGRASS